MTPDTKARGYFARRSRLKWWEGLPWVLAVAAFFVLPDYMAFGTQVLITIIFALSLDLVVGFAGVVTLLRRWRLHDRYGVGPSGLD